MGIILTKEEREQMVRTAHLRIYYGVNVPYPSVMDKQKTEKESNYEIRNTYSSNR